MVKKKLSKNDRQKIEQIVNIFESSSAKALLGKEEKNIYFKALQLSSKIRDDIIYFDAGYIDNLYTFPIELDKALEHPVRKPKIPEKFRYRKAFYGGECRDYYFEIKKRNTQEYRMILVIYYKCHRKDELYDAYIRGHEETHAIIKCGKPLEDFNKALKLQFRFGLKKLKRAIDQEILCHVGGIRAINLLGYSLEDFIEKWKFKKELYAIPRNIVAAINILQKLKAEK